MQISEIGFIYMITSPTGRIYIGSTIDIEKRWNQYMLLDCKSQRKLYNSLCKHKPENHIFEIIWAGLRCEMYKYETLIGFGFNTLDIQNLNCKLPKLNNEYSVISCETKLKMSIAAKNIVRTPEHQFKLNISKIGKFHTQEHKNKISVANKNRKFTKEVIEKYKIAAKLRGISDKTRNACIKAKSIKIIQLTLNNEFIKEWDSISIASRELKISRTTINGCCSNSKLNKSAGGFIWKYKL